MKNSILFTKIRKVKTPSQAYGGNGSAGTDFFIPSYTPEFKEALIEANKDSTSYSLKEDGDDLVIVIKPHSRIMIPSGIKVIINDPNTCLFGANKSGVSSKLGLICGAQVIDYDFQGEIIINLINTSSVDVEVKTDKKIIQLIHIPVFYTKYQEVSQEDFDKLSPNTQRGTCGFGSSGLN